MENLAQGTIGDWNIVRSATLQSKSPENGLGVHFGHRPIAEANCAGVALSVGMDELESQMVCWILVDCEMMGCI